MKAKFSPLHNDQIVLEVLMKKLILQSFSICAILMVFGVITASAQFGSTYRAEIPFDFMVNNTKYQAGDYSIGPLSGNSGRGVIAMRSYDTGETKILGMDNTGGDYHMKQAKMVFARVNGSYALSEIVTPTLGRRFKRTVTRVEVVKNRGPAPETVIVALQR